ncbi:hypothetical protein SAMN05428949_7163 [Chitinophaga sp. YR627]|nr:hypothetical protein SAMN05428949_7163 [Chitinophaga sp. YR627]
MTFLPYIFGLTSLLIGLYLFLRSFRIWKPRPRNKEQEERSDKMLEKYGTFMKVASIILILKGAYDLAVPNPDRYRIGNRQQNTEWTPEYRAIFIKNCMRDAGPTATNYPQLAKEYCDCSADRIMAAMTREQYEKTLSKSFEEQVKEVMPVFQGCVDRLRQQIDSVTKRGK